MRKNSALAPIAILAVALGLTGCGSSGEGKLTYEDSPLSKYLNAGYTDMSDEDWQKRFDEEQKKTEDLVAKCMKEEGFEYIPNISSGSTTIAIGSDEEWNPDDREWVSKYGYGMLDYPGRKDQMAPPEEDGEEYVDPNQEYVESLSQSEQDAYYETLWGDPEDQPEPDENGYVEYDWTKSGCYGAAQHEVTGGGEDPWQSEEFKPLTEAINEFYTEMYEGDVLAELDKKWSDCMAKADYDFAKRSEASDSIWQEQDKIFADANEGDDFDPDLYDLDKNPALQELQKKEVKLALADLDCRKSVNYEEESLKIQFEAEEKFIEEHKAELEAFKKAMEENQK